MLLNVENTVKELVLWLREQLKCSGGEKFVIGISGGKDSSVVASLCVKAVGKENVYGVLMPQGDQHDIQYSYDLVNHLGIEHTVINIGEVVSKEIETIEKAMGLELSTQSKVNIPARIRMTTLYAVAQTLGKGRVTCNGNASEAYMGYFTKYGDGGGDLAPIINLTVSEVKEIGKFLGLPEHLVDKVPEDGLSGSTDEESFGFKYFVLDNYIRNGVCEDLEVKEKIDRMNKYNQHKLKLMPQYEPNKKVNI